jgi:hypothetical protein
LDLFVSGGDRIDQIGIDEHRAVRLLRTWARLRAAPVDRS